MANDQALPEPFLNDPYPPLPESEAPELTRAMPGPPPKANVNLEVPFVHQLFDTPDEFDGHWACGPTSTTMVLAFLKLLTPHPLKTKVNPAPNPFGWYVSNVFSLGSLNFSATAPTLHGNGAGIYGTALDGHPSGSGPFWCTGPYPTNFVKPPAARGLQTIFKGVLPANLSTKVIAANGFFTSENFAKEVIPALEAGYPVIMGGKVNGYGHVIVVRGYYRDPQSGVVSWIVNDPFGYKTTGKGYSGANVVYNFNEINPRWLVRFVATG